MVPLGDFIHMIPSSQWPSAMLALTAESVSPVSAQNFLMRTHLFMTISWLHSMRLYPSRYDEGCSARCMHPQSGRLSVVRT